MVVAYFLGHPIYPLLPPHKYKLITYVIMLNVVPICRVRQKKETLRFAVSSAITCNFKEKFYLYFLICSTQNSLIRVLISIQRL